MGTMKGPSYEACIVEAELRARAAYAQLGRHYHDQRHLDDCLRLLDTIHDLDEQERRILRWAILWHDAVYEPGLPGNEARSADLAQAELTACGVDEHDVAEVARLIRLTESHRSPAADRAAALLISIDLAILGSDADRYSEYASDVRAEYTHVPDALWRTGRAAVLTRLLAADPLFPDQQLQDELGARARQNMEAELELLTDD